MQSITNSLLSSRTLTPSGDGERGRDSEEGAEGDAERDRVRNAVAERLGVREVEADLETVLDADDDTELVELGVKLFEMVREGDPDLVFE